MSGHHHKRVGWTYGPRPRGTCAGCNIDRTLTKSGLVVNHRQRVNGKPGTWQPISGPANTCPTCWPRPCDPSLSMCRRRPDTETLETNTP